MSILDKVIVISDAEWGRVVDTVDPSSWYEIRPDMLEVPKKYIEGAPGWAQAALGGWQEWLRFWGLETYREHPDAVKLIELGMNVPPPTETEALRNIELQAKSQFAKNRAMLPGLSDLERELINLEDRFLATFDSTKFQARYGIYTHAQRYQWVAKQTYGRVGVQQVRAILEEVSLVVGELIELEETENTTREVDKRWRELVREAMREAA